MSHAPSSTAVTLFVGHGPPDPKTWPDETYTVYVMELIDGIPQGDTLIRPLHLVKRYTTYIPPQPNPWGILIHVTVGWAECPAP